MALNYWCPNRGSCPTCTVCDKKGDLVIAESGDYVCENDQKVTLKEMGTVMGGCIINGKMTRPQIHADRVKRRKDHFQKEVMPTLAPTDQLGLMQKGYRNK